MVTFQLEGHELSYLRAIGLSPLEPQTVFHAIYIWTML